MEYADRIERWEDEQLQTLELALGFSPGTITSADIEYLIMRSCAVEYDESSSSEDDDLCLSMENCQIKQDPGTSSSSSRSHENKSSRKKSSSKTSSSHKKSSSSSPSNTGHKTEKSKGHRHRKK